MRLKYKTAKTEVVTRCRSYIAVFVRSLATAAGSWGGGTNPISKCWIPIVLTVGHFSGCLIIKCLFSVWQSLIRWGLQQICYFFFMSPYLGRVEGQCWCSPMVVRYLNSCQIARWEYISKISDRFCSDVCSVEHYVCLIFSCWVLKPMGGGLGRGRLALPSALLYSGSHVLE